MKLFKWLSRLKPTPRTFVCQYCGVNTYSLMAMEDHLALDHDTEIEDEKRT